MSTAEEKASEQVRRFGDATDGASRQARRLEVALDRAGSAFGGIIRGAPQRLSDFTEGLTKLIGVGGPVNDAMKFAEGYVEVWQALTTSGFNFGNQLDRMIISAGAANMRLDDLAKITVEHGRSIAGMGATAEQGLSAFLTRQASFFRDQERQFDGVQRRLMALGLTTEDINERFLQFDTIQTVRNRRLQLAEDQRINQAAAFAEEMDRLAKLTGKQADQLAAEAATLERQGNIYAKAQMLPTETADVFRSTIQQLNDFGPAFGDLATDILTRGFINPNDPAVVALNSFAPDLVNTLYEAKAAMERGDASLAAQLRDRAAMEAAAVRQDRSVLQMALLGDATTFTGAMKTIVTDMNNSGQALRLTEVGQMFESNMGRAATSAGELADYLNRVLEAEKKLQLEGVDSQQIIRAYNEALITLQSMARQVQERTVTGITNMSTAVSGGIIQGLREANLPGLTDSVLSEIAGAVDWFTGRDEDLVGRIQTAQRDLAVLAQAADRDNDSDSAAQLLRFSNQIGEVAAQLSANEISSEEARARLYDLQRLSREVRTPSMTVHADNVIMRPGIGDSANAIRGGASRQPNNIGTLGRTGSFFTNFGPGTDVTLHGIEGVFRPEHIEEIMEKSASGTINALVTQINSTMSRNNERGLATSIGTVRNITTNLDGRLNTLRANISREIRETQSLSPEIIGSQIASVLEKMPNDMKKAFEDALTSTIRSPIEELVSVSARGTEYQEQVYKNTKGISRDYMRGA